MSSKAAIAPDLWHARIAPVASAACPAHDRAFHFRHFVGTPTDMDQPALTGDVICLHLGGHKRVHRQNGARTAVHDIEMGALTLMPRHQSNLWRTVGPVDYVHLVPAPGELARIAAEEFRGRTDCLDLRDDVGFRDPLLEALFAELRQAAAERAKCSQLYSDSLFVAFAIALLRSRSSLPAASPPETVRGGLGDWRLKRVVDYFHDHIADDFALSDLTALTALSRAQFFRAFRQSTGTTPARYVERIRIDHAKSRIAAGESPDMIARSLGFASPASLSAGFRRQLGVTLSHYRRQLR